MRSSSEGGRAGPAPHAPGDAIWDREAAAKALGQILKDEPSSAEVEQVTQALVAVFDDKYSDVAPRSRDRLRDDRPGGQVLHPPLAQAACRPLAGQTALGRTEPNDGLVERAAAWTCGRAGGSPCISTG